MKGPDLGKRRLLGWIRMVEIQPVLDLKSRNQVPDTANAKGRGIR